MRLNWYSIARPVLGVLPAETARDAALWAIRKGFVPAARHVVASVLRTQVFGLSFPSPLGIAAGLDKNADSIDGLFRLGAGFIEVGTSTPLPQPGNSKPRLFHLAEDEAVINRLGFNNAGRAVFVANLCKRKTQGIVGANIGKNKHSADAVADYATMLEAVAAHVDYVAVNVSSPNTQGLRDLQHKDALQRLLSVLMETRSRIGVNIPLLLKIAPDLTDPELAAVAEVALAERIEGLIVSNTTVSRPPELASRARTETGGLSGRPLFALSTEVLRRVYALTGGALPLIGVGGIASGADAYTKIRAGASLVQLYTALYYQGPGLIHRIHRELAELLARDGFAHVADAVGADHRA